MPVKGQEPLVAREARHERRLTRAARALAALEGGIAEFSIRRPTVIVSVVVLMLVVGLLSLSRLGIDQFPDVSFPVIAVTTPYRGAGPEEIENLVSKPLEEEIGTLGGLKHVSSINQDGLSVVIAEFSMGSDVKDAEQQVRDRVSLVRPKLPREADVPLIRRFDPADQPVVQMALTTSMTAAATFDLADLEIKPLLAQVPNVSVVELVGGTRREIRVNLDRKRLRRHQVSVTGVSARIAGNSQNVPVGAVSRGTRQVLFRTLGEYRTLDQIRRAPVSFFGSEVPVTVGELGDVTDTVEEVRSLAMYNGRPGLFINVYRQSGTNTVAVVDAVAARVATLNASLAKRPGGARIDIWRDNAKFVRMNLDDVKVTITEGILLTFLVVYLFLGSIRSTFITGMALPNSLIGTFILMYAMGFTINIITLLALSLAVGLLIDDAIVVRENIWRRMELGEPPRTAAIRGTNEVVLAVVATTLVVISVFLPVGFLSGMVGQFFKQLGFTIVFAMAISLFDALTMAPLLSAYMAQGGHAVRRAKAGGWAGFVARISAPAQRVTRAFDRFQDRLTDWYEVVIRFALARRALVLAAGTVVFFGSLLVVLPRIQKTFMPSNDVGFFQVTLEAPPGTSLEAMDRGARAVEQIVRSHQENLKTALTVGNAQGEPNVAYLFVEMVPYQQRPGLTTSRMKEILREELAAHRALTPIVGDVQAVGNQAPFNMNIVGENLDDVAKVSREALAAFAKIKGLTDLDVNYRTGKPEFQVVMESERLKALGASTVMAGMELRGMVDGVVPAKFREGGREYDIRVRLRDDQRDLERDFGEVFIPNMNNTLVKLSNVAKPRVTSGPSKINRRDRARFIQISGQLGEGGALGDILEEAKRVMTGITLPEGVRYEFVGQAEDLRELMVNMMIAMGLGVLFMYMILASLYESVITPILIMTALPFAAVGAFLALWITGQSLNIFSMIALVLLLGLVAKNSILLVDYAYQLMRRGRTRDEALIEAGKTRLRPILMTTVALIAGMLPLALGLSEVGRFRKSMGVSVIGGLLSSTVLTLVFIPAAFGYFDRFRLWTRRVLGRPATREIDAAD